MKDSDIVQFLNHMDAYPNRCTDFRSWVPMSGLYKGRYIGHHSIRTDKHTELHYWVSRDIHHVHIADTPGHHKMVQSSVVDRDIVPIDIDHVYIRDCMA